MYQESEQFGGSRTRNDFYEGDEKRGKKSIQEQVLGIYQRIWDSREGVEVTIKDLRNVDTINPKIITLPQLIYFMRSKGYIVPLDDNGTRFARTELEMPRANSHRDIKRIIDGKYSLNSKKDRTQHQKRLAKKRRREI